jgi:hypothetical protein
LILLNTAAAIRPSGKCLFLDPPPQPRQVHAKELAPAEHFVKIDGNPRIVTVTEELKNRLESTVNCPKLQ